MESAVHMARHGVVTPVPWGTYKALGLRHGSMAQGRKSTNVAYQDIRNGKIQSPKLKFQREFPEVHPSNSARYLSQQLKCQCEALLPILDLSISVTLITLPVQMLGHCKPQKGDSIRDFARMGGDA